MKLNRIFFVVAVIAIAWLFWAISGAEAQPAPDPTPHEQNGFSQFGSKLIIGAAGGTTDSIDFDFGYKARGFFTLRTGVMVDVTGSAANADTITIRYRVISAPEKFTHDGSTSPAFSVKNVCQNNGTAETVGDGLALEGGGLGSELLNVPITTALTLRDSVDAIEDSAYTVERLNSKWRNRIDCSYGQGIRLYVTGNDSILFLFSLSGQ